MFGLVAIAAWFVWQGMELTTRAVPGLGPEVESGRAAYSIAIVIELALLLWRMWQTEFLSSTAIGLGVLLGIEFVLVRYVAPWGPRLSPANIHAAWLVIAVCWLVVVAICHKVARARDPDEPLPEMTVIREQGID
jgi:hypothetical protein